VKNNIRTTSDQFEIRLNIYYKNKKLRNIFIKNNPHKPSAEFNVVYKYTCDQAPCTEAQQMYYVGHTTTTIKERFKQHSSIKKHYRDHHQCNITGKQMLPNVTILSKVNNKQDIAILEALFIRDLKPIINIQADDFNRTLKIF